MTELLKLHEKLGLHETIEINYIVDGYWAKLINEFEQVLAEASGETIYLALRNLNNELKDK